MKQSMQLRLSQQLSLTPQLQQAIRLLQLSTIDLQQEIQERIDSNPLLDTDGSDDQVDRQESNNASPDILYDNFYELPGYGNFYKPTHFDESSSSLENYYGTTTNLQDHLRWQLELTHMSETDRAIAATIIDAIDDDGFLTLSIKELHMALKRQKSDLDVEEIEAVRHLIQQFEPVGCAYRHLSETLLVQLNQLTEETDVLELAKQLVHNDLELVGQHQYRQIMKTYQADETTLSKAIQLIVGLHPKPGNAIQQGMPEYVIPDVVVKKFQGKWTVFLNQSALPQLNINHYYAGLIQSTGKSRDNVFLKHCLQDAKWLLKSVQSRQETLYNVSQCIVDYQKHFFEHGEEAMKPLILHDVAESLGLHESTVSRITTQKYMHTPKGVFELKYFFSSHIHTKTGGVSSSIAIRALIKKLIAAENPKKPLSDNKIAGILSEQGISVARRTVAKYREAMGIAPSHERKIN